jgi:hypothetical protein
MRQPAITPSGITYEYSAIMRWLNTHSTDPTNNNSPLTVQQLYPNRLAHRKIEEFIANRL